MKKRIRIGFVLCLLTIFLSACSKPAPDEAAQTFLTRLQKGQYQEMYQQLSTEAKAQIFEEDFISRYQEIYRKVGQTRLTLKMVKPAEGEKWPIEDNRVDIPVKGEMLTWTVGDLKMDQTLHMIYEEKEWRVDWQPSNILPEFIGLNDRVQVTRTFAERGGIYDRHGEMLAGTGKVYRIGLVPGKMDDWETTIEEMAKLLDLSLQRVQRALEQKWVRPDHFVPLRSITKREWEEKKEQFMAISGMLASSSEGRVYVGLESLASTLGYMGEINQKELAESQLKGYQIGDKIGRDGLEQRFEDYLSGKHGYMIRILDQEGNEKALIKFTRPMKGDNLFLTIDSSVQAMLEQAMGDQQGFAIVMLPKTGEILGLASLPGFDANEFLLGGASNRIAQILKDPATPMLNRPIEGRYIPGSTLKPLTALAALEFVPDYDPMKQVEIPNDTWRAEPGWGSYRVKRVPHQEAPLDLYAAMKWSDNIYFAQLAYQIGSEPLFMMAERMGFGEEVHFILDVAQSTLASERPIKNKITLADTGYGQGQVIMSPLHLMMIYQALATDGRIKQPILVESEERGRVWKDTFASEENLALIQDVLKVTVQDEKAFAHKVTIEGLSLAGKTGTAQTGKSETGWFTCYHPADDPEVLVLVGIENAENGSSDAIEVARQFLSEFYDVELVESEEFEMDQENE